MCVVVVVVDAARVHVETVHLVERQTHDRKVAGFLSLAGAVGEFSLLGLTFCAEFHSASVPLKNNAGGELCVEPSKVPKNAQLVSLTAIRQSLFVRYSPASCIFQSDPR